MNPRLSELIPERIKHSNARGRVSLRNQFNTFIRLMGDVLIDDIDDAALAKFRERAAQAGYAPKTIAGIASVVRGLWCSHTGNPYRHHQRRTHQVDPQALDRTLLAHYLFVYKPLRLGGKSTGTDHQFRNAIRTLDAYLQRPATIDDLRDETLAAAMAWYVAQPRVHSNATVNKFRTHVVCVWNYLAKKRLVAEFPTVAAYPEAEVTPRAWTVPELDRLWKACDEAPGMMGAIPANLFWPALVRLAWDSGERRSALLGIEWPEVDLQNGFANFRAQVRKGRRKPNLVKLAPDTIERLRLIRRDSGQVLPFPSDKVTFYNRYRAVLRAANLPVARWAMLHCLRRSVASHVESLGGNATAVLLHSDRKTTERYLDPRVALRQQAVDLLFRPGHVVERRPDLARALEIADRLEAS